MFIGIKVDCQEKAYIENVYDSLDALKNSKEYHSLVIEVANDKIIQHTLSLYDRWSQHIVCLIEKESK